VQDALTNVRQFAAAEEDVRLRVAAAAEALRLAQRRYDSGYTGFLEVLIQQRTLYEAQIGAVQNRQALMFATVDLMRALGGGWQPDEGVAGGTRAATPAS
jgi:multidrug efflux system outer membrane protein